MASGTQNEPFDIDNNTLFQPNEWISCWKVFRDAPQHVRDAQQKAFEIPPAVLPMIPANDLTVEKLLAFTLPDRSHVSLSARDFESFSMIRKEAGAIAAAVKQMGARKRKGDETSEDPEVLED